MINKKLIVAIFGAAMLPLAANAAPTLATDEYVKDAYRQGKAYAEGVASTAQSNAATYTDAEIGKLNISQYVDAAELAEVSNAVANKQNIIPTTAGDTNKVLGVVDGETGAIGWVNQSETDTSGKADLQAGATAGNVAMINAAGQYVDSSVALSNLATKEELTTATNIAGQDNQVLVGLGGTGYTWASVTSSTFVDDVPSGEQ